MRAPFDCREEWKRGIRAGTIRSGRAPPAYTQPPAAAGSAPTLSTAREPGRKNPADRGPRGEDPTRAEEGAGIEPRRQGAIASLLASGVPEHDESIFKDFSTGPRGAGEEIATAGGNSCKCDADRHTAMSSGVRNELGRRVARHERRFAGIALDFDERRERARPLRQPRRADVERKNVRIARDIEARRVGAIPRPGRHHDHAWAHALVDRRAREASTAIVEDTDQFPLLDPARRGVERVQTRGLASGDLSRLCDRPRIHLAVQAVG